MLHFKFVKNYNYETLFIFHNGIVRLFNAVKSTGDSGKY